MGYYKDLVEDTVSNLQENSQAYPELDDLVGRSVLAKIHSKGMDVVSTVHGELSGDFGEINNKVFTISSGKNNFKLEPANAKSVKTRGNVVYVEYQTFTVVIARG